MGWIILSLGGYLALVCGIRGSQSPLWFTRPMGQAPLCSPGPSVVGSITLGLGRYLASLCGIRGIPISLLAHQAYKRVSSQFTWALSNILRLTCRDLQGPMVIRLSLPNTKCC
eukprot:c24975_g1_i1 orf=289-627(+)